jgi:hypothetical protein
MEELFVHTSLVSAKELVVYEADEWFFFVPMKKNPAAVFLPKYSCWGWD